MFKIITDSASDMTTLLGQPITTVPLTISTSEKEYIDDENLDQCEMLDYMLGYKGKSGTACPAVDTWIQAFETAPIYNIAGTAQDPQTAGPAQDPQTAGTAQSISAGPAQPQNNPQTAGPAQPQNNPQTAGPAQDPQTADPAYPNPNQLPEIYIITLTSGLSGTFNSASLARDLFLEDHPDANILVIDSLSVGPEMRMIAEKIVELKEASTPFDEMEGKIKEYQQTTRLFFGFQSIHNLVSNGRVSKVAGVAVNALNMTVMGTASPEGIITNTRKARGKKKVIKGYIEDITSAGLNEASTGKIYISHVENRSLAEDIAEALKKALPHTRIEICTCRGLVSYYAERGGTVIACEK